MPALRPLSHLVNLKINHISKEQNILAEGHIYVRLLEELREIFRYQYTEYFRLMKFTIEMENSMLETNFIRLLINDILSTKEYTLQGIAYYTDSHEDIVQDFASGINTKPLAVFLRKIIELHQSVRRELYYAIGKKIASDYSDE